MNLRLVIAISAVCIAQSAYAQSLGNAGTIVGSVTDQTGAVIAGATAKIQNPITGYSRVVTTDEKGQFRLPNVPPNQYHVKVTSHGFAESVQEVAIHSSVPITLTFKLELAGETTEVNVSAHGEDLLENVPYPHDDVDRSAISKLPISTPGAGLSDVILFNTAGVVADSNGFVHPIGDHAETTYSIDGQPISDQQGKLFSTQIPVNALQSMEMISATPNAEFGGKTSLVVDAVTRSGLGQKPTGSVIAKYGSFGTVAEESSFGMGNAKMGNFLVFDVLRTGRFLDTPEFAPIHDAGTNGALFDRFDWQPTAKDSLHLNFYSVRNWFQVPNTYDQPNQDQKQSVTTFNIAPGFQHTFNAHTLLTVNPYLRRDSVNYYPSRDPLADTPLTLAQQRGLTNWGTRADVSYVTGKHNIKIGTQLMQTRLHENFQLGVTDPNFDSAFNAYNFALGGKPFRFAGQKNINEYAFFVQDQWTHGNLTVNAGLRGTMYQGIVTDSGTEPRAGVSYLLKKTNTVLRAGYTRAFETPYNENLIVSSSTGVGGLAGGGTLAEPLHPARRNQYNAGLQQAVGKFLQISADYYWKYTTGAFDFDTLLNTPLTFPIQWQKSKIDGVSVRVSTPNMKGFQAYTTLAHVRSRFFGPETGGLIFNGGVDDGAFRIDHDQKFQSNTYFRYQYKNTWWAALTWRYDSGLVTGAITDMEDALSLTAAQQAAAGIYCGAQFASLGNPITACAPGQAFGATRLKIPAAGTYNADTNPTRLAPRHLLNATAGTDNLFKTEHYHTILRFSVLNLTNQESLYNYLSTFSGTHFVSPRTYQAEIGFQF